MRVEVASGRRTIALDVPDGAEVWTPPSVARLADPEAAVVAALKQPLGTQPLPELVRPGDEVAVAISPGIPGRAGAHLLTALLSGLEATGVPRDQVTLIRTAEPGTEGAGSNAAQLLSNAYRVLSHDPRDPDALIFQRRYPGERRGGIYLNSAFQRASVRIVLALCAPHPLAGLGGAAWSVFPGLAAAHNAARLLTAANVLHPACRSGVEDENPLASEAAEVAASAGIDLACEVTVTADGELASVSAGWPEAVHAMAGATAREALREKQEPFDLVIAGSSGGRTLAAALSALEGAVAAIADGGTVALMADVSDGAGSAGFSELLDGASLEVVVARLAAPGMRDPEAWRAIRFARAAQAAGAYVAGLSERDAKHHHVRRLTDVTALIAAASRILVIPDAQAITPVRRELRSG